jgi:pyridinium-3,5-biscarboxylic acid mononucleotide sulfurtransferase
VPAVRARRGKKGLAVNLHADLGPYQAAAARVVDALSGVRRLGVAYSGGVDSALLTALAVRVLGPDRVVAVLGVSPSLADAERLAAHEVAGCIGVPVIEVVTREGDRDAYRANGPDRCFHCKDELFTRIHAEVARRHGLDAVAYGENADDALRPDRPGALAATGHGVLRPLADAGLAKADVRALARLLQLPCADKPAAPCLASRIPHFEAVDPHKLAQVEAAEAALRDLGIADLRVRHHGEVARVELLTEDLPLAATDPLRARVLDAVRSAGFRFVALDVAGIQRGAFTLSLVAASVSGSAAAASARPSD